MNQSSTIPPASQILLQEEYAAMLIAFAKDRPRITLEFDTSTVLLLLATIKAALNLPNYPDYSRQRMLSFVGELLKSFDSNEALAIMMRSEWNQIARVTSTRSLQPLKEGK
jgi:hypothetical protein